MPRTIEEGFRDFLPKLTPSSFETQAAACHRLSVETCLKANFGMNGFFRTGSFGNGTSIYGHSDTDYFAIIPTNNLKQNSARTLMEFRRVLALRFPNTGVRVNSPAVKVPFGRAAAESLEIVPSNFVDITDEGHRICQIPNGSGLWMYSAPELHNDYVRRIDQKLGEKVKPLIRFIKAWKFYQQVPISSFYLEIFIAKYAEDEKVIVYDIDVKNVFAILHASSLSAIEDPLGISALVTPCSTPIKHSIAKLKLYSAWRRAEKAVEAHQKGNLRGAFYWWRLLYGANFPTYNYP